ncbi:MAG: hypothetical protein M1812_004883 [Candelaria pacifica]|nr:MAG: hypothetical protein M1812_004883 [Candelaria pacifica]
MRKMLNFLKNAPKGNCTYCKEDVSILDSIAGEETESLHNFTNAEQLSTDQPAAPAASTASVTFTAPIVAPTSLSAATVPPSQIAMAANAFGKLPTFTGKQSQKHRRVMLMKNIVADKKHSMICPHSMQARKLITEEVDKNEDSNLSSNTQQHPICHMSHDRLGQNRAEQIILEREQTRLLNQGEFFTDDLQAQRPPKDKVGRHQNWGEYTSKRAE